VALSIGTLERDIAAGAPGIQDWLIREAGRISAVEDLVAGLALAIERGGIPVDRLTVGIPFLLPHVLGRQVVWTRGRPVERRDIPPGADAIRQLEDSPVKAAYQEGRSTRIRIGATPREGEYPIIADLRRDGFTDYLVVPVRFSDSSNKALTVATRSRGGFGDAQVAALADLALPLAPVLEARAMRHLVRALLDVYVGPTAGARVLGGEVMRGGGTEIEAVIWFCDLRGSTDLANALPVDELISLLNEFFGAVTGAVTEHGGEVLKFIGDSVLAIFPCGEGPRVGCPAVQGAEGAAGDALGRIAVVNERAQLCCGRAIDIGIALHVGRVFFGNVGGEDRLDFTVIGPAVNLASRIEQLSGETDHKLLVSEEFARHSVSRYEALGSFQLKGIEGWQSVFVPGQPAGA
jgi:adenylate cyclase